MALLKSFNSGTSPSLGLSSFLYGREVHALMRNAYAYVQPSAIDGRSLVIVEACFLGLPIICGDIPQNTFGIAEHGP
jgi:glycosyltransferase involved in cell wall biosynthesis